MTSRIPPSRRDPGPDGLFALHRVAKAVGQQIPGAGRVAGVARPGVSDAVAAAIRGKASSAPVSGGGGDHDGTGADSTAVGTGATASGDDSTALGDAATASAGGDWGATALGRSAAASTDRSTAVGYNAVADGDRSTGVGASCSASGDRSVAIGMFSLVDYVATRGVAVGVSAHSGHLRAIALGYAATTTANDQAMVQANSLELAQSSGTAGTTIVIHDTVDGSRQRISVASGVLTVAPA